MNKLLLFLSCALAVISDMLFVWWAKKDSHPLISIVAGIILLNITAVIWSYTMRNGIESATAITIYALCTMAGCTALGYFIFHESLSIINWIGMVLATIALIMISL